MRFCGAPNDRVIIGADPAAERPFALEHLARSRRSAACPALVQNTRLRLQVRARCARRCLSRAKSRSLVGCVDFLAAVCARVRAIGPLSSHASKREHSIILLVTSGRSCPAPDGLLAALRARFPDCSLERVRGWHPPVSAGHVKKPDLLRMRLVEHTDRFGGRLQ
jgi:hypothetical protein